METVTENFVEMGVGSTFIPVGAELIGYMRQVVLADNKTSLGVNTT